MSTCECVNPRPGQYCGVNPQPETAPYSNEQTYVQLIFPNLENNGVPIYNLRWDPYTPMGEGFQITVGGDDNTPSIGLLAYKYDASSDSYVLDCDINSTVVKSKCPSSFVNNINPTYISFPANNAPVLSFSYQTDPSNPASEINYYLHRYLDINEGNSLCGYLADVGSFFSTNNNISPIPVDFQPEIGGVETLPNINLSAVIDRENGELVSATMAITDFYKYELCRSCLNKTYIGTAVDSKFIIYHPDFYPVIRVCDCSCDRACNSVEKITNVLNCITSNPNATVDSVISYALLVYFFSALLYGCFNIEFLQQCCYDKFIIDLQDSRYSVFAPLFTDPKNKLVGLQEFFVC